MKDLVDLMSDSSAGRDYNPMTSEDDDSLFGMGNTLGFADFLASEKDSISEIDDPADIFEQYEACIEQIDFRSRKVAVPAFEQYVQKVCGIR